MKPESSAPGVVQRRDAVDASKISSQIGAGQVIETVDGHRFRVASKISGVGGISFRLITSAGSLHVTASELAALEPLPRGIARLAHVLRFYAYNRDFTQYINEAVKAHDLPVDPQMDWSKWLYSQFTTKGKYSEDQLDEALHEFIVDLIYQKDVLEKFDAKKFKKERNKSQDLGRKVSIYLMRMFITYRSMLVRNLERLSATVQGETIRSEQGHNTGLRENLSTPMMQPGEEGEEVNILDTPERAQAPENPFAEAETWEDISRFRAEYGEWLVKTERPETAENILKLFDLIVSAEQKAKDDVTKPSDYTEEWMSETGKSLSYFQIIATKLSETLQKYVELHPELAETSLIARMIGDIKAKKPTSKSKNEGPKSVPRAASLSLVAIAPSEQAEIPGDTGRLPHDNTGNESSAVIILEDQPKKPNRTVAPEIPAIQHGY
jgi:hypothetical protein